MTNQKSLFKILSAHPGFKIAVLVPMLALGGLATASGAKPNACTDTSVTTSIEDVDSGGNSYTIASDGHGSYLNGVDNVMSILTCNGYNGIKNGDWQFNKPNVRGKTVTYSGRKMGVSLNTYDAVLPGDPHYTADANPPFWGTQILNAYSEVKCTLLGKSMLTMTANTAMTCPMIFSFFTTSDEQYGLSPAHSFDNFPEDTDVQVACNSVDSGGCKDWFIEPIGSLQAVGRLGSGGVNHGDFYMRFRFHITRP